MHFNYLALLSFGALLVTAHPAASTSNIEARDGRYWYKFEATNGKGQYQRGGTVDFNAPTLEHCAPFPSKYQVQWLPNQGGQYQPVPPEYRISTLFASIGGPDQWGTGGVCAIYETKHCNVDREFGVGEVLWRGNLEPTHGVQNFRAFIPGSIKCWGSRVGLHVQRPVCASAGSGRACPPDKQV